MKKAGGIVISFVAITVGLSFILLFFDSQKGEAEAAGKQREPTPFERAIGKGPGSAPDATTGDWQDCTQQGCTVAEGPMPEQWSSRIDIHGDYMPLVLPMGKDAEVQVRVNGYYVYTKNAKGEKFVDGEAVNTVPIVAKYIEYRAAPGSVGKWCTVTIER